VPSLEALIAAPQHDILLVVTQPDRPKGRGQGIHMSPVKQCAIAHGIEVLQPEKIGEPEFVRLLRTRGDTDSMVVVAYGQKIPPGILNWPKHGVVNVHGSILPKYRGASPIETAIMAGETQTGVTTMLMDEGWDTGDILLQETVDILPDETAGELGARLAVIGARLLVKTLDGLERGAIYPIPQDDSLATYAKSLPRAAGWIDWGLPSDVIVNRIRGCTPRPGAYTVFRGIELKVWKATARDCDPGAEPGVVVEMIDQGVVVATGTGRVVLESVQPSSRQRMSGCDFARGARVALGDRFELPAQP